LTAITMLASMVALLFACASFIIFDTISLQDDMVRNLSTIADVIGQDSIAALVFEDTGSAQRSLEILDAVPSVVGAGLFTGHGNPFVEYRRRAAPTALQSPAKPEDGHRFANNSLLVFRPIMLDGERIGTIYIQSDLRAITTHLMLYGSIGALVFLTSLGAAFIIAQALQRMISEPVVRLVLAIKQVSDEQNYAVRAAPPDGHDEVGALTVGFNDMLAQVQKRDTALHEAHDQLEQRVAERTRDLQQEVAERVRLQESLLQRQKMEAVGQLAGGIAHDFNNLLQVILGNAELAVLRLPPDHPVHKSIGNITRAAQKAAVLTARLLAFGQRSVLQLHALKLDDLTRQVAALFQRTCDPRILIEVIAPPDIWSVQADPDQIQQVLTHLCRNACEAMPDGGRLILGLANLSQDHQERVRLTVTDTGVGMDAEICRHIFEPFFTTKGVGEGVVGKGTGLGLAMAQGVVIQHGGSIAVESQPGQGSRFIIDLPRHVGPADPPHDGS